jgi:hypothetical protein
VLRGQTAKWNDQKGWHDQDGLPLPSPLLVVGVDTLLIRWHPQREERRDEPLPDPALLNSVIPAAEWRVGLDGQPEKPWKLNWEIHMVDPATGALYLFVIIIRLGGRRGAGSDSMRRFTPCGRCAAAR